MAKGQNIKVKVIIEVDLLTDDEKVQATRACIAGGANFIKTATGFLKESKAASVEDVKLIKGASIGAPIAIKAAGGIHNYEQAKALIDAGATRVGTSAAVEIIEGSEAVAMAVK